MSQTPGRTPGLRVPLSVSDSGMYLLVFGHGDERHEVITTAQLMTLVVEAAELLGLRLTAPQRPL